jgi:nicotinamidase-related amidase
MTLVLIDIQPCYAASNFKRLHTTISQEVNLAKSKNRPIILVEFDGGFEYFPTHPWLLELVQDYDRFQLVTKRQDDGGKEVIECIRKHRYRMPVRVCGVNWEACVFETVMTLSKYGRVQVVKNGCGSWRKRYDWKLYDGFRNVEVV